MNEQSAIQSVDGGIGHLVTEVAHSITQCFNKAFEQYDITFPQSRVMAYLFHNQDFGDVNQRDLEKSLGIKASSISSLVRNLENKGFVQCERRAADARNKRITLTDKGLDIQRSLDSLCLDIERTLTKGISDQECEGLTSLLGKVRQNIAEE